MELRFYNFSGGDISSDSVLTAMLEKDYCGRGNMENFIKEGKNGYMVPKDIASPRDLIHYFPMPAISSPNVFYIGHLLHLSLNSLFAH